MWERAAARKMPDVGYGSVTERSLLAFPTTQVSAAS